MKEKIGLLTVELEKTKADNVKLYGKIRYVQDYNHERVVSRGSKKVLDYNFPDYYGYPTNLTWLIGLVN